MDFRGCRNKHHRNDSTTHLFPGRHLLPLEAVRVHLWQVVGGDVARHEPLLRQDVTQEWDVVGDTWEGNKS